MRLAQLFISLFCIVTAFHVGAAPLPLVQAVDHVTVTVTDLEQSHHFYGELLGLEEMADDKSGHRTGRWYRLNSISLHLVLAAWTAANDGTHIAFWADDVYRTAQLLENAGVLVSWDELPPEGIDRFTVRDPSGNLLEIRGCDHSP